MDDVSSMLPLISLAFDKAENQEVKRLIDNYFGIVKDLSEAIKKEYTLSFSSRYVSWQHGENTNFLQTSYFAVVFILVSLTPMIINNEL